MVLVLQRGTRWFWFWPGTSVFGYTAVHEPAQQQHWLDIISIMMLEPNANMDELTVIRGYIVDGVTLPL
ncbi:MAG: hypothetical protein ACRDF4_00820, partial [Rhabdochlamydiaceae bacterium]